MQALGVLAALAPLAMAVPCGVTPHNDSSCTTISSGDFSWAIEGFKYSASYVFSTPAHQVAGGTVTFNLSNPALPGTVSCSAYSSWLTDFFYGNINYDCVAPEGSTTKTSFAFNEPTGELAVNQTWTCDESTSPTTFTALGSVVLPLDCKEDDYQNPNWQIGQIYSSRTITCGPVDLTFKPHDKTAVA